jgi:hypothetical protein
MRVFSPRARAGAVAAALGAAALSAAHLHAVTRPELTGPVLVLDNLFEIALTCAVLALCAAVGQRLTRRLAIPYDSPLDELVFSAALGAGLVGTLLLLLATLGGLRSLPMALLLAACCAAVARELVALPGVVRAASRELVEKAGTPALVVFLAAAAWMVVVGSAPPTDYDSLMYHLQIPANLLERGSMHVPDGNLHVSFIGPFHLLYVLLLAWGASAAPALLNVAFTLGLGAVLLTAGTRLVSPAAGRLALVLLWGSPMLVLVGITPKVDSVLACYLFLGHYALLRAWRAPGETMPWFVLAGAVLGFAIGVKYLALGYILALAPMALLVAHHAADTARRRVLVLAAAAGAVVLGALPWLVKNWILLGAPLYPQLAEDILPPWLATLYGSSEIPLAVDPASLHPLRDVRQPFSIRAWFLAPELMTPEGEGTAYTANPAFAALLFSVLMVRNRAFMGVLVPGLLFIGAVLVHNLSLNLRYLAPALPALTLASALLVSAAASRARSQTLRVVFLVLVTGLALSTPLTVAISRMQTTGAAAHALGGLSRAGYLLNPRNPEAADYARMTARVNELTSPEDRILLLFEARGFRFEAHTLPDNVLLNWPLALPAVAEGGCLEPSGATHVLVATRVLGYFRSRGLDPATIGWDRFPAFATRCLTPVEMGPGWALFRL